MWRRIRNAHGGFEVLRNGKNEVHFFRMNNQEPLKILKQIVSMFLAINGPRYRESFSELINFVQDPMEKALPNKFRIMAYLNIDGLSRYMGHSVVYKPHLGGLVSCSEIAFPPFGYILTFDFPHKIPALADITHFKNFGVEEVVP